MAIVVVADVVSCLIVDRCGPGSDFAIEKHS
jgi:hypothetical protein